MSCCSAVDRSDSPEHVMLQQIAMKMENLAIQNNEKALIFATKACALGLAKGCVKQGYYLLKGTATNPNQAARPALSERLWKQRELLGCHSLGLLFAEGRGVEQNTDTAMRLLGPEL